MEFPNHPRANHVERWPSEVPLAILIGLIAASVWLVLTITIVGLVYAVMIGAFFWVGHLAFVTHLRGSAVRLGPDQFPELYQRVSELSRQVGLAEPPTAYVMEASGTLNALATRFLRTNFIVLFSDLLEACGENEEARDFIIAHELGHVKAGHLKWRWVMLPGLMMPFLGSAYSRACEYTCDRYGMSIARDRQRALRGLAILAAGGRRGAMLNLNALAAQRYDLDTPLMQIGTWLSTHPPLCERVVALEPALLQGAVASHARATIGALAIIGGIFLAPIVVMAVAIGALMAAAGTMRNADAPTADAAPMTLESAMAARPTRTAARPVAVAPQPAEGEAARARADIQTLASVIETYRSVNGELPRDVGTLYAAWATYRPNQAPPMDPYDGERYGYEVQGGAHYRLWSAGPDIEYSSRTRSFGN